MNVQFKKGAIELCVLAMLLKRDCYGYEVSECISRKINISESTIYPILRKLKDDGLVTSYIVDESWGPPRKYYRMTGHGKKEYEKAKSEWLELMGRIKNFLED